jgi:hypothetical protein
VQLGAVAPTQHAAEISHKFGYGLIEFISAQAPLGKSGQNPFPLANPEDGDRQKSDIGG